MAIRNSERRIKDIGGEQFERSDDVPNTLIESFPVNK
jgi:hypothetical protein